MPCDNGVTMAIHGIVRATAKEHVNDGVTDKRKKARR